MMVGWNKGFNLRKWNKICFIFINGCGDFGKFYGIFLFFKVCYNIIR